MDLNWIKSAFTGSATEFVGAVGNVIDKFHLSPGDANALKTAIMDADTKRMAEVQSTIRTEIDSKSKIIVAEMNQTDKYTKRARPTLIYFGLIIIALNYLIFPLIYDIFADVKQWTASLPVEFWAAWGGAVSIWSIGRTAETMGKNNKATSTVTGQAVVNKLWDK